MVTEEAPQAAEARLQGELRAIAAGMESKLVVEARGAVCCTVEAAGAHFRWRGREGVLILTCI
jgi:hypothetical protein